MPTFDNLQLNVGTAADGQDTVYCYCKGKGSLSLHPMASTKGEIQLISAEVTEHDELS